MDESTKNSPCEECDGAEELQLHAEVNHLRQHLAERDAHIVALEGEFIKCTTRATDLEEQVTTWREKYERLYDSHKRVQKLNQVLEDKLLQMVDKMKGEKSQLTKDIATLSVRLAESKHNYSMLQKENERYKNDMNLAIQLLQCKPDNFVSQKLDSLPVDTQARVSQYVMSKTSKPSNSSAQSKNGNEIDTFDASEYEFNISASLMSKILEDSIQDTVTKHCDTCTCNRSQNKPFSYNESYYSVATQTLLGGTSKNSLCLNCNSDVKSIHSNLSIRSNSPHTVKLLNERAVIHGMITPMYILPQYAEPIKDAPTSDLENPKNSSVGIDKINISEKTVLETLVQKETPAKVEDLKQFRKSNSMNMEPAIHHKLCDLTKSSISSFKSSPQSAGNEDRVPVKELLNNKEVKHVPEKVVDNVSVRKNSHSSMGAVSRTSSIAKSTVSTHKSNTQVGPGPRFCHLRMQAGSKNILLDNAEPDVPPVLYRRQSKCNENSIFKDLIDDVDHFIDLDKADDDNIKEDIKNDNIVVESTLIDVNVDNNVKDTNIANENTSINPILLNVSSSPLQPLKTHTFSNGSENNNNKSQSVGSRSQKNTLEIDNLLNDFNADINTQNNNISNNDDIKKADAVGTIDNHDMKIFNFDLYEQNKLSSQSNKSLRKIDVSQIHSLENTKISKHLAPPCDLQQIEKKPEITKSLPPIVNVYPNLTQTHLKVNETTKVFTNEQSTSSLSSDDSAAILQKQQLLRVAEWVEKNLEQQNSFNDPLDEDVSFLNRALRRDSKLSRLTETLNELALNMPHPVSKYSRSYARDAHNTRVHNAAAQSQEKTVKQNNPVPKLAGRVVKETIFPVECGDATVTEITDNTKNSTSAEEYNVVEGLRAKSDKDITPEDLARMEYNVKKFLLSGPHWVNPNSVARSRRTSSKTETDV